MSRIGHSFGAPLPVGAFSLSNTLRRNVTLSGTEYVAPRSWHSATEYICRSSTGVPQTSSIVTLFGFGCPQAPHSTRVARASFTRTVAPQCSQAKRRCSRPSRRPLRDFRETCALEFVSYRIGDWKSLNGKTLLK